MVKQKRKETRKQTLLVVVVTGDQVAYLTNTGHWSSFKKKAVRFRHLQECQDVCEELLKRISIARQTQSSRLWAVPATAQEDQVLNLVRSGGACRVSLQGRNDAETEWRYYNHDS